VSSNELLLVVSYNTVVRGGHFCDCVSKNQQHITFCQVEIYYAADSGGIGEEVC
jgi:hypothetical protein